MHCRHYIYIYCFFFFFKIISSFAYNYGCVSIILFSKIKCPGKIPELCPVNQWFQVGKSASGTIVFG